MKTFLTCTEIVQQQRRRDIRDKSIAAFLVLCLFGLAGDLWLRAADSLYGRFFLWVVQVAG